MRDLGINVLRMVRLVELKFVQRISFLSRAASVLKCFLNRYPKVLNAHCLIFVPVST